MQAFEMSIFEFLSGAQKIITEPFHRTFCADISFAENFYNTILKEDFCGVFTLKKTAQNNYSLIDGYSRLMMFSLIMCAISNNNIEYKDFVEFMKQSTPKKLKIEFLGKDNDFYKAVSTNYFDDLTSCSKNLSDIYNFFLQKTALSKRKTHNFLKKIFNAKAILLIIEDNEILSQHLYQGMNTSGYSLSEYDEIKIAASKSCSKSQNIFNNYFLQFEREYSKHNCEHLMLPFIKDYLTIQNNGIIPQNGKIAIKFKAFLKKITKIRKIEQVFEDFYRYSRYYLQIVNETVKDEDIKQEITRINSEEAIDAYPYLMEVFEDWDKNNINKEMMLDILKMVNLFIEQRKSSDASSFVMSFARLSNNINKMLALRDYTPKIHEEMSFTINKICNN